MKRELIRTSAFIRALRRFVKRRAGASPGIEATLSILAEDAFDSRLKTHKLKGDLEGVWACSAG